MVRSVTDKAADIALSTAGIQRPERPNLPSPAKSLRLTLEASKDLNADADGQGLSVVARLYQLKDLNAFLAAPYSAFGNPDRERQALGDALGETREVMISPGQRLEFTEKMTEEMPYLGVVTLFRAPAPKRWRFAFAAAESEAAGITLGLHACAMTATSAVPSGMPSSEAALLSSVKCR